MMRLIGYATLLATSLLPLSSCYRVPKEICPQVSYTLSDRYLKNLPSAFPALTTSERATDWGTELYIGTQFAKNLDLYRAITALQRAAILIPDTMLSRKHQIDYQVLLCYYLGKRYNDLIEWYESANLAQTTPEFPAFHDLLTILYDAYTQLGDCEKADQILKLIEHFYPDTYSTLTLSSALKCADFPTLRSIPDNEPLQELLCCYDTNCKSPQTAALLNGLLPGAGYLYLGQKQTALTAFLINGLFIASSVYFFIDGPIPAGIVTASFELGWYLGGIYGAARSAKFYNERLYESLATPVMQREGLFPVFRLEYAF